MRGRRRGGVLALSAALSLAACGGGYGGDASTPSPLPSGSLGVVTPGAAAAAVQGLCDVRDAPDAPAANAAFYDRTHQELHVIAAATEERDRQAAGVLLEAMQRVEAELERPLLPGEFSADVEALAGATRAALDSIGLDVPACT
jgi:hypothetical protein